MMRHQQPQRNVMCVSGATRIALRWCLLATAALCVMKPTTVSAQVVVTDLDADTFFTREDTEAISAQCENLDYVTGPLFASDADGNGVLNQAEFVVFTDLVSGGWLSDMGLAGSFQKMPLVLQEANVVLTCLCELYSTEPWGQPGCCDNTATSGIRTDGSGPDEKPDAIQLEYLTYVCGTMSETLGRVNAKLVAPPSSAPSDHPSASPTLKPTMQPTMQPSLRPVTASPTVSPSQSPASPTVSPSQSPTTSSPTGSPSTLAPTSSPTLSPVTTSPTFSPIELGSPTKSPTATPSVSPSDFPSTVPSLTPTLSTAPTAAPSSHPSSAPSLSSVPSVSSAPSSFSGDFPVSVNFVQYLKGGVTAEAIMEGKTNQVKVMMEEALLKLANLVIEEMNNGTRRELMLRRRELLVEEATNATVIDVEDIDCPQGVPGNATTNDKCLAWNANIVLKMVDEVDPEGRANEIRRRMLSKLASGWLEDDENFDQEEALKPPGDETKAPIIRETELNQNPLSVGGVIGIALASLVLVLLVALFATHRAGRREDEATEERNAVKDSHAVAHDLEPAPTDDVSEVTESHSYASSYASGAYLLGGQKDSSAGSALGKLPDESEDDSYYDPGDAGDEEVGFSDSMGKNASQNASYLAAMGAASTLVASTSPKMPRSIPAEENPLTPESAASSAFFSAASGASPASAGSEGGVGSAGAGGSSGEGLSNLATAGIGGAVALTAGAIAAGAYMATKKDEGEDEPEISEAESMEKESILTSNSQLDELDIAIEAGDWGHVGALAAVLAAEGRRTPPQGVKSPRSITSGDGASSRSRGASTGQSMDRARAAEIDKLVEAGDWQGVVLAAARFEADQTMDGESHSATSASRSSRWSGSGRSSASGTQRSFGTTEHSSHGAGRSQAEIRAEVEALVRRVVPEEADNIDEMLNQFKGREEELVETLRRMQERAIASRARLAVQKSVKLEARARARSGGGRSVASQGSSKELEQAIEEGNWLAVGQAAQKISDQTEGGLSLEDKEKIRQKISQSPAMNTQAFSNENVNLDELIEKGDWSGVIAAAKAASEGGIASNTGNISKEEQDALAQASMWQAIANQSKQDGGPDSSGAGDAADWAISRSLNALNSPGEKQSRTINDIADEESSDASQYESGSYSRSPDFKGSMV